MSQAPVETDDGHPHPFQQISDEGVNRLLAGGPREHFAQIRAFLGRGHRLGGGVPATEGKAREGCAQSCEGGGLEEAATGQVWGVHGF